MIEGNNLIIGLVIALLIGFTYKILTEKREVEVNDL